MSRTCDGGACVVVVHFGDNVYAFTSLHLDRVIEIPLVEWQERVTNAQQDGFDAGRFFAQFEAFLASLSQKEISRFRTNIRNHVYDIVVTKDEPVSSSA